MTDPLSFHYRVKAALEDEAGLLGASAPSSRIGRPARASFRVAATTHWHTFGLGDQLLPGVEAQTTGRCDGDVDVCANASPPSAATGHVRKLQQSAGNVAVGRLLRQEGTRVKPKPKVTMSVVRGGLSVSIPRTGARVLKGDLVVLKARVKGVRDPSKAVGAHMIRSPGTTVESGGWEGDTYVWRVRADAIGRKRLDVYLVRTLQEQLLNTIEVVDGEDPLRATFAAEEQRLLEKSKANPSTVAISVVKGGLSPSIPRSPEVVLRKDLLVVKLRVKGFRNPSESVSPQLVTSRGMRVESRGWHGDTFVWNVRAASVGEQRLDVFLVGGLLKEFPHTVHVVGDITDRLASLIVAGNRLTNRFDAADLRIARAGIGFTAAYRRQEAELKAVDALEKFDRDLTLRLLIFTLTGFAGGAASVHTLKIVGNAAANTTLGAGLRDMIEGAAGGVVGDVIAIISSKIPTGESAGNSTGDAVTDLGRGIGEYLGQPRPTPTPTDTPAPSPSPTASPTPDDAKDRRAPDGPDPLTVCLTLQAALKAEKLRIGRVLEAVSASTRDRIAENPTPVLYLKDVAAWASRPDPLLDTIAKMPPARNADELNLKDHVRWESYFYEVLWGGWVRVHYFLGVALTNPIGLSRGTGNAYSVETPGRHVDEAVRVAARTCGYRFEDFLEKYGSPSVKAAVVKIKILQRQNLLRW